MNRIFALMLAFLLIGWTHAGAQDDDEDLDPAHFDYIEQYEGTATCLECHLEQAEDVFHSVHYQWRAQAPELVGAETGTIRGKMVDINDFCTNPGASWIDIVRNEKGDIIADGCSKCHTGFGLKPSAEMTREQLENIDCMICHAPGYQRRIEKQGDTFRWVPKDGPELLTLRAKNIRRPTAPMCMRCHVGAGGGTNFKRGDMESAHFEPGEDLDVHFAGDMACVECHTTRDHRIAGRGIDLSTTDLPGEKVACENCHGDEPHGSGMLDRHVRTVHCTVCHIPDFARYDATDMFRDWSHVHQHEETGKWEATMDMQKHVTPEYTWWNGKTIGHDPAEAAEPVSGTVRMAYPAGNIADPDARIYPFKVHGAKLPVLKASGKLVPIHVNHVFKTGNVTEGVIMGAKDYFGIDIAADDFEWVTVERYMGLFHEVLPAAQSLKCSDCHTGSGGRLDWKALGYPGDPRKTGSRFRPAEKSE